MIQFNLLPDVKLEYIKAQRTKKLVILVASGVTIFSVVIFSAMIMQVYVIQKRTNSNLDKEIKSNSSKLTGVEDVDKILTVQNQLSTLVDLQNTKHSTSNLFTYLSQLTPTQVKIGKLSITFDGGDATVANSINFSGTADSLETVNKFADTLKFTTYIETGKTDEVKAFKNVVLTTFTRDDKLASYTINVEFDSILFDNTKKVTLKVPKQYTTRSITEEPNASLFDGRVAPPTTTQTGGQ
jgi:Tfp pilus assembly protein PilN